MVPMGHYRKNRRVWSVMIEVCRDLYMDEKLGTKDDGFLRMRSEVGRILGEIREFQR